MRAHVSLMVLLLCACAAEPPHVEGGEPSAAMAQRLSLAALRTGLLATIEALGHDKVPPQSRVIVEWSDAQAVDQVGTWNLSTRELNRTLAAELGLEVRAERQTTCEESPHPTNMHPCRLNFQGVIYRPSLLALSSDSARVAVFFFAWPNTSGTRIMDMARESVGWRIVKVLNVAS